MNLMSLIVTCSVVGVHPKTTQQIIQIESSGDELALNVNGDGGGKQKVRDKEDAVKRATNLIAKGKSVDIGLMQLNSKSLAKYAVTPEEAFDPCKNIKLGTQILKDNYDRAEAALGPGREALKAAVSSYNSGDFITGQENGYVDKFYGKRRSHEAPAFADIAVTFDYEGGDSGFSSSRSDFEKKDPGTTNKGGH